MTDRYDPIGNWIWCPALSEVFHRMNEHYSSGCSAQHEVLYRRISPCGMQIQVNGKWILCEEDEGHGQGQALRVHSARDGDGLMVWWQSA